MKMKLVVAALAIACTAAHAAPASQRPRSQSSASTVEQKQISYKVTLMEGNESLASVGGVTLADGKEHPTSIMHETAYVTPCETDEECNAGKYVARHADSGVAVSVTPEVRGDGSISLRLKISDSSVALVSAPSGDDDPFQYPVVVGKSMDRYVSLSSGKPVTVPFGDAGRTVTVEASEIPESSPQLHPLSDAVAAVSPATKDATGGASTAGTLTVATAPMMGDCDTNGLLAVGSAGQTVQCKKHKWQAM